MQTTHNRYFLIFFLLLAFQSAVYAQYGEPLKIPPNLSANFGELRNNHFHSGLDFKTQQVVNKPVYAVADGYISRISVSAGGYGNALYINHPETNQTSVYGHLNSFSVHIANYVEEEQYKKESFNVNLYIEPDSLPVKKGDQIALSGNRGSSGGPHLHFEIRDTKTQNPLDPLQYVAKNIVDTQKPDIRGVAFYPINGKGLINESIEPVRLTIQKAKSGQPLPLQRNITAWGKIGIGVKAYDKMNGQANIYGVKHIRLFVDEEQIFSSTLEEYSFSETRLLNSFIDFEDWRNNKSFFMKSFIEPGNTLHFYQAKNRGYIQINEERTYQMRYELEDHFGNTTIYNFSIEGKLQEIPIKPKCKNYMAWQYNNKYVDYDFALNIPSGNLYSDFCFTHNNTRTDSTSYYSDIHHVNHTPIPLHKSAKMWIKIKNDSLLLRSKYGIVKLNKTNNRSSWVGGTYKHGGLELNISELGDSYAISIDTIAPNIVPLNPQTWKQNGRIRIRLSDDKSGLSYFRGTIDGQYVLFEHDSKSSIYTYTFNRERLSELPIKNFKFIAKDGVGNESIYEYEL
ncbi:MAG: M23 family metallopeptidase [Dysgonamonadaceae bacterium]|nr:M23 family metallopeptidase [Dysgonamonadaceae bacterium]